MTTQKERDLMAEIVSLALDIGAGTYDVCVDYSGHIHGVCIRIAKKASNDWVYYTESIYLSGRDDLWGSNQAIDRLEDAMSEIKKYHPQFDADGVKL